MKRVIALITLILVFATLLTSCEVNGGTGNVPVETIHEKLNRMVESSGSSMTVKITTDDEGKVLESVYRISNENAGKRVAYTEERFSEFKGENGEFIIPESYKYTLSGEVLIADGAIVESSGDSFSMDLKNLSYPEFNFKSEYFISAKDNDGVFEALVISPSRFLNRETTCTDMTVSVSYGEKISNILLSYKEYNGPDVTIRYTFN